MFTKHSNATLSTINTNNYGSIINQIMVIALFLTMVVLAAPSETFAQRGGNREVPSRRTPTDDNEHTVLVNPLSPDDPRAKLDPALEGVPAMPRPISGAASFEQTPEASATVEFNLKTGVMNDRRWNPIAVPSFVESVINSGHALLPGSTGANLQQDNADAQPSGPRNELVIGDDNRQKITNTAVYPWRAMVKLYQKFPNGLTYSCSGTLINAKYVLTAGHCIYSAADGGWATSVKVIPGLDGTYQPYGSTSGTKLRTYTAWTNDSSPNHDFALVTLAAPIGLSTGWLGMKVYSDVDGRIGNLAGYPGDRDGGTSMYYHCGPVLDSTDLRVFYRIDTYKGQSGSGVYHIEPGPHRYVFAVHAYSNADDRLNSGTRLDKDKFASILSWIATGN